MENKMSREVLISRWIIIPALAIGWAWLFFEGVTAYIGSKAIYTAFSLVFLGVIAAGIWLRRYYGPLFFVVFIWLGLWFKFTAHTIYGTEYIEPIGSFVPSAAAYDQVLLISSVAGAGLALAMFLAGFLPLVGRSRGVEVFDIVPLWYERYRKQIWSGLWIAIISLPGLNLLLGINQAGLAPRTILPWPGNAFVSWCVTIGISMAALTLLNWDILKRKKCLGALCAVLAEAAISSVSLLSRSAFLFHSVPLAAVAFMKRDIFNGRLSKVNMLFLAVMFLFLFVFSMTAVNTAREYWYAGAADVARPSARRHFDFFAELKKIFSEGGFSRNLGGFFGEVAILGTDRWVGIEGVMAIAAYPDKGRELFLDALMEKRQLGKTTIYQTLCDSHYRFMDADRWSFAALPGPAAFFYYSGSLLIVFWGMFLLVAGLILTEQAVLSLTSNKFLCALWGVTAASDAAQFGLAPRSLLPYYGMIFCGMFCIWALQRKAHKQENSGAKI